MDTKNLQDTETVDSSGGLAVSIEERFKDNPIIADILDIGGERTQPETVDNDLSGSEGSDVDKGEENEDVGNEEENEVSEDDKKGEDLSEIDIDALTPEQRAELAVQLDADIKERIDTISNEKLELEKEIESLKSQIDSGLQGIVSSEDPYPDAQDADSVKQAMVADRKWRDQLFEILTDSETEIRGEKEGFEIRGKFYTKQQVKDTIREIDNDIFRAPEQLRKLERIGQAKSILEASLKEVEGYSWYKDAKSEPHRKYTEVMQNPEVQLLKKIAPSFAAQLPAIVAAWADKSKPRAKTPMKLPLRRSSGSGSIQSSGGGGGSGGLRNPEKDAARQRLKNGSSDPVDVVKSFFF